MRLTLLLGLVMVWWSLEPAVGGNMDIVRRPPCEGMMIGGASGAFVIANSFSVVKSSLAGVMRVIKAALEGGDHNDLLALMFELARLYKTQGTSRWTSISKTPRLARSFSATPS